jgi:predicted ArsR family transcriptional regulator
VAGFVAEGEDAPPSLAARERGVLVALCRRLLDRDMFTKPASTRTIADELVITQAAVKQHLVNLYDMYDKFAAVGRPQPTRQARPRATPPRRRLAHTAALTRQPIGLTYRLGNDLESYGTIIHRSGRYSIPAWQVHYRPAGKASLAWR